MNKDLKFMIFIVAVLSVFFIANHLHDVGDIAGDWQKSIEGEGKITITNGFLDIENISLLYHISWYVSYACFLTLIFSNIYWYTKCPK